MRYEDYDSLIMSEDSENLCYIADMDTYELLHITKACMRLYGLNSPADYLGKKCYQLLQGLSSPCEFCTNACLVPGKHYKWEHYNEKLGRWVSVDDSIVELEGRRCRLERAKDVTAQHEQLKSLSDQLNITEVLLECVRILAKEKDYDIAFQTFLQRVGEYYQANRAYIFEFDLEDQMLDNTYEWCAPGVSAEKDNLQRIPMEVVQRWLTIFKSRGEFYINSVDKDVDPDSDEFRILQEQGIQSLLAAPIYSGDQIVGFLGVDDPTRQQNDMRILRASTEFIVEEIQKNRMMKRLEFASYTDMLTGLRNRNRYIELLSRYEANPPESLGVIFADVNGMKAVNDTYGHKYGDRLLVQVASFLKRFGGDQVYRIGGDEFVVLLENISRERFEALVADMRDEFELQHECDVSFGSVWRSGDMDVNALVMQADERMYAEKQGYYRNVLSGGRGSRLRIVSEVAREIVENQFVVFYQPQLDIRSGRIVGAEALVRKKASDGSLIRPDMFIPYYETEGVVRHVDMFVLDAVCTALEKWQRSGRTLNISVNFSSVTLMEEKIVDEILAVCKKHGVSPERLTIEVTESISRMETEQLNNLIRELEDNGFTMALDDFGAKESNLAILGDVNFQTVKLDRSLLEKLESSEKSRIILRSTIQMCRDIKKPRIFAEGIETAGQADLLLDYNCEYGQGYYFSEPVNLECFERLLDEERFKTA